MRLDDQPAILERMLLRPEIGVLSDLLPAERLAAIVASGDLLWDGPAVVAFNGAPLAGLFAAAVSGRLESRTLEHRPAER